MIRPCRKIRWNATFVPLEKNSGAMAERYRQWGGVMALNVIKGQGHTMWSGWFECQELVDFVIAHAHKGGPNKSDARDRK